MPIPRPFSQSAESHRLLAFSLVELLVVMAIISILLSLMVPSLGPNRAASLNSGGNLVAGVMDLARQNATTKNAMTAVVLATDSMQDSYNRVLAVYQLVPPANGQAFSSSDWKQVAKWQTLPSGVIVDQASLQPATVQPVPAFPAFLYKGTTVSSYRYIIFLPQGNLLTGNSAQLRLAQGYFPSGQGTPVYTAQKAADGSPANSYTVSVLAATGRLKIDRQ